MMDTAVLERTIADAGRVIGNMSDVQSEWKHESELSDVDLAANILFWREHGDAITRRQGGGAKQIRQLEAEWEKRHP